MAGVRTEVARHHRLLLGGGNGGDQQPQPHGIEEKGYGPQEQHQYLAPKRDVEPQDSHQGHQDDIPQTDEDKGDALAQHQLDTPDGSHQDLLQGADLLFPHHRQGREHQGKEQHHHGDDPGHHGVAGDQVGVEPGPGLQAQRKARFSGPPRPLAFKARYQLLLGIIPDGRTGVAANDEGGVGVGGVHDHLDLAAFPLAQLPGEIPLDPQGHGDLTLVDQVQEFLPAVEKIINLEPVVGGEPLNKLPALLGAAFVENGGGHVLDVEIDHVAISQELDQGRPDEKKAELFIPPNLNEFLDDDVPDTSEQVYIVSTFSGQLSALVAD